MVLTSPRTFGTPPRPGSRLVTIWLAATVLLTCAAGAEAQSSNSWRARLSQDLARLAATNGDFQPTDVILTASQERVDRLAARHGLTVLQRLSTGALLRVPANRLAEVAGDREVGSLSGNYVVSGQMGVTNQAIGADQVQAGLLGTPVTGKGIGVAVIDSGVANVPELRGRIAASMDFTNARGQALDYYGHGTHVAGIIAAAGQNVNDDTRGVAPGAHIINLKVLDAKGKGYVSNVIAAIDWAIANRQKFGIRILNLSLGAPVLQSCADDPLCQAVERAHRAGLVVVASAGNFGKDANGRPIYGAVTAPGNSPFAITVGALNTKGTAYRSDDVLASYSSKGPTLFDHLIKPDVVAPGNRIRGLLAPGARLAKEHPELVLGTGSGKRLELSGTSMAAAAVSGAAALVLGSQKNLAPLGVRMVLQLGAEDLKLGLLAAGAGSINVAASVARGQFDTVIAGESIRSSGRSFGSSAMSGETVLWGETVL